MVAIAGTVAPMKSCLRPSRRLLPTSPRPLPWHPHRISMAQYAPQRSAGHVAIAEIPAT